MTDKQTKNFLAQFERSRKAVAKWPKWMRDNAVIATASFPKRKEKKNEQVD
jgi:hypothetical protein